MRSSSCQVEFGLEKTDTVRCGKQPSRTARTVESLFALTAERNAVGSHSAITAMSTM